LWLGTWFITPIAVKEICSVLESQDRKIISFVETVKVYSKDGKNFKEIQAKIDTGAYSSSIDEKLASELGFDEAIEYYKSFGLDPSKIISEAEAKKLKEADIEEKLTKHEYIDEAVVIRSANGTTYRIKIPLIFYLKDVEIRNSVSVADRSNLSYSMLIGRRDLGAFLVDPRGR